MYHIFYNLEQRSAECGSWKMVNLGLKSKNCTNNTITFNDTTLLHWVKIFSLSTYQWWMKLQAPYSHHLDIKSYYCYSILYCIYDKLKRNAGVGQSMLIVIVQ